MITIMKKGVLDDNKSFDTEEELIEFFKDNNRDDYIVLAKPLDYLNGGVSVMDLELIATGIKIKGITDKRIREVFTDQHNVLRYDDETLVRIDDKENYYEAKMIIQYLNRMERAFEDMSHRDMYEMLEVDISRGSAIKVRESDRYEYYALDAGLFLKMTKVGRRVQYMYPYWKNDSRSVYINIKSSKISAGKLIYNTFNEVSADDKSIRYKDGNKANFSLINLELKKRGSRNE